MPKDCPRGKIRNPETGKCIDPNGKVAKKLKEQGKLGAKVKTKTPPKPSPKQPSLNKCAGKHCKIDEICNPASGRCVKRAGKLGQEIAKAAIVIPATSPPKTAPKFVQEPDSPGTITLTFGDVAENHKGMQKMGEMAKAGLSYENLQHAKRFFESKGIKCDFYDLSTHHKDLPKAYLLVARNGCSALVDEKKLLNEQTKLEKDTKAFMYGKVVEKKARYNLCFSDFDQKPNYEKGEGTVVNFSHLPYLSKLRKEWPDVLGTENVENLQCEGNYYYDIKKTFIGFHGDTERKIVIGTRLGESFPLHYQWFIKKKPIGPLFTTVLNNGDIYFMSEKASGYDWKRSVIYTLRHAAGDLKLIKKWKDSDVQKFNTRNNP